MNIHILPSVGTSLLRNAIEEQIKDADHELTEGIACAHYVVGLVESEWYKVQDEKSRIVLITTDDDLSDVSGESILVNALTLTLIDRPNLTLCDWLSTASSPFKYKQLF